MIQRKWVVTGVSVAIVSVVSIALLNGTLGGMSRAPDGVAAAEPEPDRMVELVVERKEDAPKAAEGPRSGGVSKRRADRSVSEGTEKQALLLHQIGTTPSGVDRVSDILGDDASMAGLDKALQGVSGVEQQVSGLIGNPVGVGVATGNPDSGSGALARRGSGLGGGGVAEGIGGLGVLGVKGRGMGYGSGGGNFAKIGNKGGAYYDLAPAAGAGDQYDAIAENGFQAVADTPLSTFSVDVDTASYANVQRLLDGGEAPPRDAVRIEELLNYFPYDYAPPTGGAPFATHAEVTAAPWAEGHRLVRIGIKGKEFAEHNTPPRNLVFLVDVSGSMSSADRLPLVQRGLAMLARQLGPEDHVSLVVYAGAAGVVLEPTRGDRTATILDAIDRLQAGGSTAGAAGIRKAYDLARTNFRKGSINRVILATDGDFNVGVSSEAELVELIEEERKSGVFLTVLGVGRGNLQDAKMELLADKGNGNYAYIDTFSEMRKVLGEQAGGTLVTIAKDVKIQVEFNPALVASYRLVGYENRVLAARDFDDDAKDAGEIGAGHTVTALYEVVPAGAPGALSSEVAPLRYQAARSTTEAAASGELLTVKLRYKAPDGDTSKLLSFPVRDDGRGFAHASTDTRFAAAVAAYGMLLRDSPHKGTLGWAWVRDTAREALGADTAGYRAEFLGLIEKARRVRG